MMRHLPLLITALLFCNITKAQNFQFPTSGNAVNNKLAALTAADGVELITTIRSTGCAPGASSTFRFSNEHVSTGAIYRNTSWAINCMGSTDIIKLDFTSKTIRPQGLKFSIFDVDNGSDSVSVMMYKGTVLLDYSYTLYSPTFVSAYGKSNSSGFVGSGSNNAGLDDNRGRIDIACNDIMARVDSVIVTKFNSRNVTGNPSQSFAAFEWTNFVLLPLKIVSFNASVGKSGIDLDWTATSETGSEMYQVAFSDNGINFSTVGTPVAAKITGISNSYKTRVASPDKSTAIYARLQSQDRNGAVQVSNIVKLNLQGQHSSTVYPVIFQDKVTLTVQTATATKAMVAVAGMDGVLHYKQTVALQAGSNAVAVSLPQNLSAGIYRLYYRLENGTVQQHSIVKY